MPLEYISKNVDIYNIKTKPNFSLSNFISKPQITIGDLHGNAIKLLFALITHGIITMKETHYQTLVKIYQIPNDKLTKQDLLYFNRILNTAQYNNSISLRLLGDEVADRGKNDVFMLHILHKLDYHGIDFEIIASNHGMEFIKAYEQHKKFYSDHLGSIQASSIANMQTLFDKHVIRKAETLNIINTTYKAHLKALSYTLDKSTQEMHIFSHAPIGLDNIKNLAQQWAVPYADSSTLALAKTIDNINVAYSMHVKNNRVHKFYKLPLLNSELKDQYYLTRQPFTFILWNRDYSIINRPKVIAHTEIPGSANKSSSSFILEDRPKPLEYKLNFVHGHDSSESTRGNIYNLDNELGKTEEHHRGKYNVLFTFNLKNQAQSASIHNDKTENYKIENPTLSSILPGTLAISPFIRCFSLFHDSKKTNNHGFTLNRDTLEQHENCQIQ